MPRSKRTQGKIGSLPLKPRLLVIAIMCLSAAASEPPSFNIAAIVIWIAGTLAIGLFAYAALALLIPAAAIAYAYARRSLVLASRRTSKS